MFNEQKGYFKTNVRCLEFFFFNITCFFLGHNKQHSNYECVCFTKKCVYFSGEGFESREPDRKKKIPETFEWLLQPSATGTERRCSLPGFPNNFSPFVFTLSMARWNLNRDEWAVNHTHTHKENAWSCPGLSNQPLPHWKQPSKYWESFRKSNLIHVCW